MLVLVLPGGLMGSDSLIVLLRAQSLGLYPHSSSLAQTEVLSMLQAALDGEGGGCLAGGGKRNQGFVGLIR